MGPPKSVTWTTALLTALCAAIIAGCAPKFISPDIEILGVEKWELGVESTRAVVILEVRNPNAFGGTLVGADYRFEVNGAVVGQGELATEYEIPPEGSCRISLPLELNHTALIVAILDGDRDELSYAFRGTARLETAVGAIESPFEKTGRSSIPDLMGGIFK